MYQIAELKNEAQRIIDLEVRESATELVNYLWSLPVDDRVTEKDLILISVKDDYKGAFINYVQNEIGGDAYSHLLDDVNYCMSEFAINNKEDLLDLIKTWNNDECEMYCQQYGVEPYELEMDTWYIVSPQLGKKLWSQDECVNDLLGLTIWGRRSNGRPVNEDKAMLEIAKASLAKKDNQATFLNMLLPNRLGI